MRGDREGQEQIGVLNSQESSSALGREEWLPSDFCLPKAVPCLGSSSPCPLSAFCFCMSLSLRLVSPILLSSLPSLYPSYFTQVRLPLFLCLFASLPISLADYHPSGPGTLCSFTTCGFPAGLLRKKEGAPLGLGTLNVCLGYIEGYRYLGKRYGPMPSLGPFGLLRIAFGGMEATK